MSNHEVPLFRSSEKHNPEENFVSNHYYAAYTFNDPGIQETNVGKFITIAKRLGFIMRYWWHFEDKDLKLDNNALVIALHHPNHSGKIEFEFKDYINNYNNNIRGFQISWDEEEYIRSELFEKHGHPINDRDAIISPNGSLLYTKGSSIRVLVDRILEDNSKS